MNASFIKLVLQLVYLTVCTIAAININIFNRKSEYKLYIRTKFESVNG